jgi:hypothetical protein
MTHSKSDTTQERHSSTSSESTFSTFVQPTPAGATAWVEKKTRDGRLFYYHRETKQRTWRRPGALEAPQARAPPAPALYRTSSRDESSRLSQSSRLSADESLDAGHHGEGQTYYVDEEGVRVRLPGLESLYQNVAGESAAQAKYRFTIKDASGVPEPAKRPSAMSRVDANAAPTARRGGPEAGGLGLPPPPQSGGPRRR